MPELPEVEVTRRGIAPHLTGRTISGVAVREPRLRWPVNASARALKGLSVRSVARRGKYLLIDCGAGHLIVHLGMSGSLRILPRETPPGANGPLVTSWIAANSERMITECHVGRLMRYTWVFPEAKSPMLIKRLGLPSGSKNTSMK